MLVDTDIMPPNNPGNPHDSIHNAGVTIYDLYRMVQVFGNAPSSTIVSFVKTAIVRGHSEKAPFSIFSNELGNQTSLRPEQLKNLQLVACQRFLIKMVEK